MSEEIPSDSDGWTDESVEESWAEVPPEAGAADEAPPPPGRDAWEPTGHRAIDEVLASLDTLDEQSVHDHVAVFEEAHRALRRALDDAS